MKKRKIIALTLLVAFLCSLCIPGTWAIAKDEDNPSVPENKGMKISKTATPIDDDTYTITLEAYATGEKISTEVTKDVPTDIILVLDQSGSMKENDFPSAGETTYEAYTGYYTRNSNLYSKRHNNNENNGNLYYDLGDGVYVTVGVTRTLGQGTVNYDQCPSGWSNSDYYQYTNNLYIKVGDEYKAVTVNYTFNGMRLVYTYTYESNGKEETIAESRGMDSTPDFDGMGPLYVRQEIAGEYTYTYFYTDAEGDTIKIGTSTGDNTRFTDVTLYYRNVTNGGNITRLRALKNAVTQFENSVAQKAAGKDGVLGTADDVDHRIAVVGFSCSDTGNNSNYNNYQNTELFIGATEYRYKARYNEAESQYGNAFQSMKTTDGQNNVIASIDALDADGATYVNHGLEMANGILDANPVPAGEKRNRVVIVFTDGAPGYDKYDSYVADSAIREADGTRNKGANVYSVGILNGADATSAGNQDGNDTQKANWFMQNLSDNKGTPQSPSYYLSASDADTLNNIFQQISDQIQEVGSAIDLGSEAVIKDIISPQFELPTGATAKDITLETYSYTGEGQWRKNSGAMGATAAVNGEQVNVTGFDFAENWCGTETKNGAITYRGNKLVISFPVKVKDGFLGGNGVYTNTEAGVYENAETEKPLFIFERPQVDVQIKEITVSAVDKNVYLLGDLTAEQIKSGATAKVGEVTLDLTKADQNYGLATWQHEYVDIAVAYADKEDKVVTDLNDLTDDTNYTVTVTITPKSTTGTATEEIGSAEGKINVFKPVLTFRDAEVYYGANVPDNNTLNEESFVPGATVWKHGETLSTGNGVTMIGTAPVNTEFAMTYTPEPEKTTGGKINSKTVDIPVDVANVKIGNVDVTNHTTFQHIDCDGKTCTVPTGKEFLLHPKTCTLTITKQGGDSNEPYVFDIMKNGQKYSEVTIVGNHSETIVELPVGTYTIQEDTGWSWRYNPAYSDGVILSKDHASGTLTSTNTKSENYWLNGYSNVVKNTYGQGN